MLGHSHIGCLPTLPRGATQGTGGGTRWGRRILEAQRTAKGSHEDGGAWRLGGSGGFSVESKGWPDSSRGRGAQGPQGTYALDQNVIQEAVQ